ncbi:OLC1v1002258C1 [Oldenlandia corymbosa var. corymbosa]|uniref:GATA transcription factor n=1 Tax=Oldenlandia corymbosa var. corymbosa TaxID=529605 RepID=A0AAV1D773_OLDCO|nr:OLC1v1002258C1 [Oldenlandia corymbosa var. corymbosa]
MDCMAAKALKNSSFLSDFGGKSSTLQQQQPGGSVDDVWYVASAGAGGLNLNNVPGDDFSVDDLLDFSDKDFKDGPLKGEGEEDEEKEEDSISDDSSSSPHHHRSSNFSSFSETDDFGLLLAQQLTAPADNLENLEWLSQFVDDSQSELSLLCPVGSVKDKNGSFSFSGKWAQPAAVSMIRVPCFPLPVPVKARSKRSRPNGRGWSGSPSLTSITTTESSTTTTSSSSYGSSALSPFAAAFSNAVQDLDLFSSGEKPPAKKQKVKKPPAPATAVADTGSGSSGLVVSRRCTHCQVQKTPQWRAGPLGPKTLCNACGVRYKSGRLFPEYRPACSPTFSQEVHSNSHRKVLEMRRKKEMVTGSGFTPMVPSF